jgi:hypothetical protein
MGTTRKLRDWCPRTQTSSQAALGAAHPLPWLLDVEDHFPLLELLAAIVIANDPEGVVQ